MEIVYEHQDKRDRIGRPQPPRRFRHAEGNRGAPRGARRYPRRESRRSSRITTKMRVCIAKRGSIAARTRFAASSSISSRPSRQERLIASRSGASASMATSPISRGPRVTIFRSGPTRSWWRRRASTSLPSTTGGNHHQIRSHRTCARDLEVRSQRLRRRSRPPGSCLAPEIDR